MFKTWLLGCFTLILLAQPLQSIRAADQINRPLIFATEANYPPFVYLDKHQKMQGFDVELVKALCQQMQTPCQLKQTSWASLIPALKQKQVSAIMGAFSVTEERKKNLIFSDPIYLNQSSFILRQSLTPITLETLLKDKQVGVQQATIYDHYLTKSGAKKIRFNRYQNIEDALYDLTTGRIEAALGDKEVLMYWLEKHVPTAKRTQYRLLDTLLEGEVQGYAIAINQQDQALQTHINQALAELKQSGKHAQLLHQYGLDH